MMKDGKKVGGTLGVEIEVRTTEMKEQRRRSEKPEQYPFGSLEPSKLTYGTITGESFWMPDTQKSESCILQARRCHFRFLFTTRYEPKMIDGVAKRGHRVWKLRREDVEAWGGTPG